MLKSRSLNAVCLAAWKSTGQYVWKIYLLWDLYWSVIGSKEPSNSKRRTEVALFTLESSSTPGQTSKPKYVGIMMVLTSNRVYRAFYTVSKKS